MQVSEKAIYADNHNRESCTVNTVRVQPSQIVVQERHSCNGAARIRVQQMQDAQERQVSTPKEESTGE
jgi:hypothetical protein